MHATDLIGRLLSALDDASPTAVVDVVDHVLHEAFGARRCEVLLIDYELETLTPLPCEGRPHGDRAPVEGPDAGDAFRTQEIVQVSSPAGTRVFVPLTLRAEQLGVLEIELPAAASAHDLLPELAHVGACVAHVLRAVVPLSDVLEGTRRHEPMALAAEMQWALLPIRAFNCARFSIAGQLVPAYEVGGDMFDLGIGKESLLVTATDAMGHGLRASLLTTLAVNTLRNARRSGASIDAQAAMADRTLNAQFGGDQFVTALIMHVDLATGDVAVVNAGSPHPYRLDEGALETVLFEADLPLGLFGTTPYAVQHSRLRSGQRLVLVSDGVLEAQPRDGGEPYGDRRLEGALLATRHLRPHEAVRLIAAGVRTYRNTQLRDDATIVCLDWK
jgi:Stage II sporulation protein E (SpoIIE)